MNTYEIEKLENVLENYLNKFDCELLQLDTDFYCYPDTKEIAYALTFVKDNDKYFNNLFKQLGLKYNADPFILALFHEIGHCVTWEHFNKLELLGIKLAKKIVDNGKPNKAKRIIYPYLLDEFKATQWACNYINKHPKEIKKLWEAIQPKILKFYLDNGLI